MVASVSKLGRDSWRYYHDTAAGCPADYYSGQASTPVTGTATPRPWPPSASRSMPR